MLHPDRPVTIGVPLPTYSAVILDLRRTGRLTRRAGEIGIAGIGLADGYLNRPDQTGRAFIPDFLSVPDNPSGRIYRTGDLGRVNGDGEIEHHGRIDTQVKIRGYRIEPGEIEAVLRELPGDRPGRRVNPPSPIPARAELVAYYSREPGADVDPDAIHALLRTRLPPYMVPAYLERARRHAVMPSGKVDRQAPAPAGRARRCRAGFASRLPPRCWKTSWPGTWPRCSGSSGSR